MDLAETQPIKFLSAQDVDSAAAASKSDIRENRNKSRVAIPMTPAMLNSRWTPVEMERALRPLDLHDDGGHEHSRETIHFARDDCTKSSNGKIHTTILLYGEGYQITAKETVRLMNSRKFTTIRHEAIASPLPTFVAFHDGNKESSSSSSTISSTCRSLKQEQFDDLSDDHSDSIPKRTAFASIVTKAIQQPNRNNDIGKIGNSSSKNDALILFTSGTSSPKGAKGVRLSHCSLLVQAIAKTQPPCHYDSRTRMVATTVPWFHVGGISSALAVLWCGGCLVFPSRGNTQTGEDNVVKKPFEPKQVWSSLIGGNANTLVVVPTMLHAIIQDFGSFDSTSSNLTLSDVRLILVGGQSIGGKDSRLFRDTRRVFPNARIVQTYACTEAGSSITFEDLGHSWNDDESNDSENGDASEDDGDDDTIAPNVNATNIGLEGATSVGIPPPHIQIGIFDPAYFTTAHERDSTSSTSSLQTLAPGNVGIIGTKGSHTMSGYWTRGSSSPTANTSISENEWMFTNDLGFIHPKSGKLFFCGRANDVIRTGGESVLATEVEKVLSDYEAISECAVFALPDVKFGEAVCAAIVVKGGLPRKDQSKRMESREWKEQLREYCSSRQLAGFKRPRRVFCMDEMPRNSSGKILKHELIKICSQAESEIFQSRL